MKVLPFKKKNCTNERCSNCSCMYSKEKNNVLKIGECYTSPFTMTLDCNPCYKVGTVFFRVLNETKKEDIYNVSFFVVNPQIGCVVQGKMILKEGMFPELKSITAEEFFESMDATEHYFQNFESINESRS